MDASEIDLIAEALIDWHQEQIDCLYKVVDSPDDMKIVLQSGEESLILEGKDTVIYKAGVLFSIQIFENFPLKAREIPA
ncbi:hypothetical protein ACFQNF_05755 [Iodobacter arcticus]|uniref:Uncharacterized protein n=1 Tax=Iodobacter arcticus TaxID=590593 RepID=A0ABW2QV25_9NEIS